MAPPHAAIELIDLACIPAGESLDLAALQSFYTDLIEPAFPIEDELDDLEDWVRGLDPTTRPPRNEIGSQSI